MLIVTEGYLFSALSAVHMKRKNGKFCIFCLISNHITWFTSVSYFCFKIFQSDYLYSKKTKQNESWLLQEGGQDSRVGKPSTHILPQPPHKA